MRAFLAAVALAWAGPVRATVLTSPSFSITAENFDAAGSTGTKSANFQTFANAGDLSGVLSSVNFVTGTGDGYTLFNPPLSGTPAATCSPTTAALSVSSIRWALPTPFTNAPLSYDIYTAANPSIRTANVTAATFEYTGLSTNTAYSVAFAGVNASGAGSRSVFVKAYTMAAPPVGSTVSVFTTSAALTWGLNENPLRTVAWVDKSTESAFLLRTTSLTASTVYSDSGLLACTSYFFRIRNLNGDGYPTDYDTVLAFQTRATTPAAPGGFSAASLAGNRIAFNWEPSGPEGITGYNLYYDGGSGIVPSTGTAPFAVLPPSATSFMTGVLASTAAYSFHLTAKNRCGIEEASGALAAAASTRLLSSIRAAVASPQSGRGSIIAGGVGGSNALTVSAALLTGTPSKVLFQYKRSLAALWTDIASAVSLPFAVAWDITDPAFVGGTFEVRAVAFDQAGIADAAPSAVTITVAAAGTPGAAGERVLGGVVTKTITLDNSVSNTLVTAGGGRMTSLTLPPGSLNSPNADVSVVSNPDSFPAGAGLSVGLVAKITLGPGQSLLPGATASFTLSYPDTNDDGIIDGTNLRADSVRLISNSGLPGAAWNQDIATSVDLAHRTLTGLTSHFSFFAVAGAVQPNLDSVRVYPVPYKPNGTDPGEGRPYTGAAGTGIVFDNLPAVATIKIYTVSGTMVAKLAANAGTGALVWDARSDAGKDVASGGYFAVISTPGSKSLTKRLAIVR